VSALLALVSFVPARVWAGIAIAGALVAAGSYIHHSAYQAGYQAHEAREAQIIKDKTDAANAADNAAVRCAADPTCRMRPDQYLRR
jgi:hypothetical protein